MNAEQLGESLKQNLNQCKDLWLREWVKKCIHSLSIETKHRRLSQQIELMLPKVKPIVINRSTDIISDVVSKQSNGKIIKRPVAVSRFLGEIVLQYCPADTIMSMLSYYPAALIVVKIKKLEQIKAPFLHRFIRSLVCDDDSLNKIASLTNLTSLEFDLTDLVIENRHIYNLTKLQTLHIPGNNVLTEESLTRLTQLKQLGSFLDEITDNVLAKLTHLTSLEISGDTMSDRSIERLNKLETLICDDTQHVTDSAVKRLTNLKCLRALNCNLI